MKEKKQRRTNEGVPYVDDESEDSLRKTNNVMEQEKLPASRTEPKDLPEQDRADLKDGVFKGKGTGAAVGGTSEKGGATVGEDDPKLGTTGQTVGAGIPGGSIENSSAMTEQDAALDDAGRKRSGRITERSSGIDQM